MHSVVAKTPSLIAKLGQEFNPLGVIGSGHSTEAEQKVDWLWRIIDAGGAEGKQADALLLGPLQDFGFTGMTLVQL